MSFRICMDGMVYVSFVSVYVLFEILSEEKKKIKMREKYKEIGSLLYLFQFYSIYIKDYLFPYTDSI